MTTRPRPPLIFLPLLAAALLCAARQADAASPLMSVQVASAGEIAPLASQSPVSVSSATASASQIYQPAPMPNPDIDPPHGDPGPNHATLTPALFSHQTEFQGDGYAAASSIDHGLDERRKPAAGLNWSVPVK